jgi:hypothetical protein
VNTSAVVRTPEAEALALRMRKHFGHKVEVELDGAVSRVRLPAGTFELEPYDGRLAVRVTAEDDAGLLRVKEVVGSHLARFARDAPVELTWSSGLEERLLARIASHRNARHLERTRDWVRELRPGSGESLVLAALLHDVERGVPGGVSLDEQIAAFDDEQAVRAHSERSARIAGEWLRDEGASAELVRAVEQLICLHETGGSEDADVLQAADSLSFLETNPAAAWMREGRADAEHAMRKLRYMRERIQLVDARRAAQALYEAAVAELDRGQETLSREAN